jgi:hypothetical protein
MNGADQEEDGKLHKELFTLNTECVVKCGGKAQPRKFIVSINKTKVCNKSTIFNVNK